MQGIRINCNTSLFNDVINYQDVINSNINYVNKKYIHT